MAIAASDPDEKPNDLHNWTSFVREKDCPADAVGPVLSWLRGTTVAMMATQGGIFLAVRLSAECQDGGGYPTFPVWIWAVSIPALVLRNCAEWQALMHFLDAYVTQVRFFDLVPFKVFGCQVSFKVWLTFYLICSNLAYLITDSFFAAVASAGGNCPDTKIMVDLWANAWQQSGLGVVGLPVVDFSLIVLAVWVLSFLQMVVPLTTTIRQPYAGDDYGRSPSLCGKEDMFNDDKFGELSEAAGLARVQSLAITTRRSTGGTNGPTGKFHMEALPLSKQMVNRFLLTYIAENALQSNLQSSLFAINRYATDGQGGGWPGVQALGSIVLSLGLCAVKVVEAISFFDFAKYAEQKFDDDAGVDEAEAEKKTFAVKVFRRNVLVVRVLVVILLLLLAYALFKLVAAFWCPDSLVNLTGCFDESAVRHSVK